MILSARGSGPNPIFVAAVIIALCLKAAGAPLTSPAATMLSCAAMMVLGLPHGTLDLNLLARQRAAHAPGAAAVLALYLGLAAATYLLWRVHPVLALAAFVAVAVAHFAEDWREVGSPFLAHGMALSLLAAPTLLWRGTMSALFVDLAGDAGAAIVADLLLTLLPVSLALAGVTILALWREGRRDTAIAGTTALVAMIALPPAVGFALFFCLFHSPRHFAEALATLSWRRFAQWRLVVGSLTLTALVIAVVLMLVEGRGGPAASVVAASFMTLSILTVPHMAVPAIIAAWPRRGRSLARHRAIHPPPKLAATIVRSKRCDVGPGITQPTDTSDLPSTHSSRNNDAGRRRAWCRRVTPPARHGLPGSQGKDGRCRPCTPPRSRGC